MFRVGLFLTAKPFDGGSYQYSQSVLEAITGARPADASAFVAYTDESWSKDPALAATESLFIRPKAYEVILQKCAKFGILSSGWLRNCSLSALSFARDLLDADCDLWIFPNQDAWAYVLPFPALVSVFDLMHRYERGFPEVSGPLKYRRRESHYKQLCSVASGIFVDSRVGMDHVMESYGIEQAKMHILPFVAPLRAFGGESDRALLDHLPEKYFFYPAQFWAHKNHLRLLEAIARLGTRHPDIHLVLAGSKKNNYSSVLGKIQELGLSGRVHVTGYVSDATVVDLYSRARALVMPTFFGPTNIPPLEAMRYGCPVAVSEIYAMPEQLGAAALYFDPNSVESIAEVLDRLWTDDSLCFRLAERGLQRSREYRQDQFSARLWTCARELAESVAGS